jgi:hypothetical protein
MPLQPLNQQQPPSQGISRQQIPQVSLDSFPIDPAVLQQMAQDEADQVSSLVEATRIAQKHKLASSKEEAEGFTAFVNQRYQAILERLHGKKVVEKPRVSRAMATTRTRTTALRARGPSINFPVIILSVCVTLAAVACYQTIMNNINGKKSTATTIQTPGGKKDYDEIRRTLEQKQQDGATLTKREQDDLSAAYVAIGQKEIKAKNYSDAITLLKKVSAKSPSYPEAARLMRKLRRSRR